MGCLRTQWGHGHHRAGHFLSHRGATVRTERAREMFLAYNAAIDTIEDLVTTEGIDCAFERTGKLTLACKPSHYTGFERSAELISKYTGQDVALIPPQDIRDEIGSSFYHGAMVDPLGAGVHVGKLVHGLARAAAANGVSIHEAARSPP